MQELYFFFDDSGILHKSNTTGKFVYAGYVFKSREDLENAKRRYRSLALAIKKSLHTDEELKASKLCPKHKNALYKVLRDSESLSVVINISAIYPRILNSSKSICRYKDYILKRIVKAKIRRLIDNQDIDPSEDITIHLSIDEQLRATDGIYGLKETIIEELQYGIKNYNYETFYPPLFQKNVFVELKYCESKTNYLIQAADILANRIFTSYRDNKPKLREIPNHNFLTLP